MAERAFAGVVEREVEAAFLVDFGEDGGSVFIFGLEVLVLGVGAAGSATEGLVSSTENAPGIDKEMEYHSEINNKNSPVRDLLRTG